MEQWRRNAWVLWLAVLLAAACWTMVMPFMPVFLAQDLGVAPDRAPVWAGVLSATNSLGAMLMAPIWGAVGDRYGRRLMMLRAGAALTVGYFLMTLVTSPVQLLAVRVLIGLLSGFIPMAMALVGVSTPREYVGRALGMVQTAWPAGTLLGPLLGGVLLDLVGLRSAMGVAAALIMMATVLVFLAVREQVTPVRRSAAGAVANPADAASLRALRAILVVTALAQSAGVTLEPVFVPFARTLAGPAAPNWVAGALYALPGAAFITMAPWWARRGERSGFTTTVAFGLAAAGLMFLGQSLSRTIYDLGALRLGTGLAMAAVNPGVAALIATTVPEHLRGRAYGLNHSASAAGQVVGPTLGGFLAASVGVRGVFVLVAAALVFSHYWVRRVVAPRVAAAGR